MILVELVINYCGTALAIFLLYFILLFAFACGSLILFVNNICTNLGVYNGV